ncbi:hypothetical protein CLERM_602 [Coxiella-like endosymbiont]|nr:hypothetical protein [Coxiella endosymbiont of Rhipicephalus microplus]PMB54942.1 hypothetical protein CLERM_602 [Coxiella-like endosymbiont]
MVDREDDLKVDVKSTAILLRNYDQTLTNGHVDYVEYFGFVFKL